MLKITEVFIAVKLPERTVQVIVVGLGSFVEARYCCIIKYLGKKIQDV